jgi:diguanylate cyclase (GGDEF)-like protein/PAS domain S-box-containing protein
LKINKSLHYEQLQQLYSASKPSLISSMLLSSILAYIQQGIVPNSSIVTWLSLIFAVTLLRLVVFLLDRRGLEADNYFTRIRLARYRIGVIAAGIVWGSASFLMFPASSYEHELFLVFLLAGLTAGSVFSLSADFVSALAFSIAVCLPLMARLFVAGDSVSISMGLAVLVYVCFMMVSLRHINHNVLENIAMRLKAAHREKLVRASEEQYRLLLEYLPVGIIHYDTNLVITYCNDRFCSIVHNTGERLIGLDMKLLKDQAILPCLLSPFKGESGHYRGPYRATYSDTSLMIDMTCASYRDVAGQVLGGVAIVQDVTEPHESELKARVLMHRHDALMSSAMEGIHILDINGNIVEANETFCNMLGYDKNEVASLNVADWDAQWSKEELMERLRWLVRENSTLFQTRHRRKDGSIIDVEISTTGAEINGALYLYASSRDITDRKKAEEAMRIAAITFETQEGILVTDANGTIIRVNRAFQEITGYRAEEVVGRNPRMLQSGRHDVAFYRAMWSDLLSTGNWAGEIWDRRKNGEIYPKLMTITAVYDDKHHVTHYVAVFRDISNRKKSEQEIHHLAFYDSLTQLPNRRLLMDRLQQAMAVSARNGWHGALLFLDLDNFKTINDTQGHAVGDQLLIEAARRLQACLREGDSVARLGGDEFVVVLEDLSGDAEEAANQAEDVAQKVQAVLNEPYMLQEQECMSPVSIGISLFRGHHENADDVLTQADVAMYQAKVSGRNSIRFFDPQMQRALEIRADLEADLRHALERGQFQLHYQLQVDNLRRPLGAEVLLRWNHPKRGFVSPKEFIPLAEETGLIVPIGLFVLEQACKQLQGWQNDSITRGMVLSVNVSAKQLRQPDFVFQVQRVLQESGAKPSLLKLELTESTVLDNVEYTINKMRELRLLGLSFSLDDFGTGYSSLQYLKQLPLDQIKIDQSFVRDIVSDINDAAIVQTIIAMTTALGLGVIAEGVETIEQYQFLDQHGCHSFQGYLFGKPLPIEQFEELLRLGTVQVV